MKEHTEGCAATQNAPLEWIVRKYKEWQQSSCDLSRVDPRVMVRDDSSELANCSMAFMDIFYKGLTTRTDIMQAFCEASQEEEKCLRRAKHIPLSVQFNLAEDMDRHAEYRRMCNRSFSSTMAPSGRSMYCVYMKEACIVFKIIEIYGTCTGKIKDSFVFRSYTSFRKKGLSLHKLDISLHNIPGI